MDSFTGAVYTSPSGMFLRPSHLMAGMSLMEKDQVSTRSDDVDLVGPVHHFQRIHGFAHLFVIQGTHIEVEIFKGQGFRQLSMEGR